MEGDAHQGGCAIVDVQPPPPLRCGGLRDGHQFVTNGRFAPIELAAFSVGALGTLGVDAQVLGIERRKDRQHLLHHRGVGRFVIVFTEPFHTVQLDTVLPA